MLLFNFLVSLTLVCVNGQDTFMTAPRLVSEGGNLKIYPAYGKNISFEVFGRDSWINIGDINLIKLLENAINASTSISRVSSNLESAQQSFATQMRRQMQRISTRLVTLEGSGFNTTPTNLDNNNTSIRSMLYDIRMIKRRMRTLTNRLNRMTRKRDCSSNPCQHGGTCIESISGYRCLCPGPWEGPQCAIDVDECVRFAGTDLGCQNGATCVNKPGGYDCRCAQGWFGLHCTMRSGHCDTSSNTEICGHGICINQNKAVGYDCICDQGWTKSNNSPACTQDVDECVGLQFPCSVQPMVPCINIPGRFLCGSCPAGYTGNGYYCTDINECLTNNGGCSTNPNVECINTVGSSMCGACPPGYQGNGIVCTFVGVCQINNGGCSQFANCLSNPMIGPTFVQCQCRDGYTGSGYGAMGCTPLSGPYIPTPAPNVIQASCIPNPCVNGACIITLTGRRCICLARYTGELCDQLRDPCDPQPCLNGGTCIGDKVTMGYRCDCPQSYTGHNCATKTKACGGVRDMAEGRIAYPDSNSTTTYNHNSTCVWIIRTQSNKVLNITFTKFDLETSNDCIYDWLQMHDGQNTASHYIGRFCGSALPMGGNIISTQNYVYLWFRSDHLISKKGFALSWTSVDPLCGGEIDVTTHGVIKSPGFPGKYPNNRDCKWVIRAPTEKRIQLHFFTMQIEESSNCDHDFVAIYEGPTTDDSEITKLCGSVHPAPLLVPSPTALIYFRSDGALNDYGFQISYAVVEGVPGCGAVYTQESGQITPPTSGGKYLHHVNCEYKINLSPDSKVKLTFKEFSLESSTSCLFDYVAVYDGDTRNSPMIGQYCGTQPPPTLLSTTNKMLVVFVSDSSISSKGFRILYEKVCNHVYEESTGIVRSPGYPVSYPDGALCTYLIKVPAGNAVVLKFLDFDIEESLTWNCPYDFLEIFDGDSPLKNARIAKYCGANDTLPNEIISTHNYLYLEFYSDSSNSGRGFEANYTTIHLGCGGILKETTGTIEYPIALKDQYDNNIICRWILSAPESHVIRITKNVFDLEYSLDCTADFVEISNNDTVTGQNEVIGKYCGTEFPASITSTTNVMTIKFSSDYNIKNIGFSLYYMFVDVEKVCGGTYLSSSGVITSPGWPKDYFHRKDCVWIIIAPQGQQIALNISKFEVETHSACKIDYLEIRNGGNPNSPLLGRYCGTKIPQNIPSMTNSLYIHFHSDGSLSFAGFYITWDSTSTGCGGLLTSYKGTIISPNYPNKYGHNAQCLWRITTNAASVIQLTFAALDLEKVHTCFFDYVQIYDGYDMSNVLGRYCSMDYTHGAIVSKTNNVFVKFVSDMFTAGSGFMLNYVAECKRNLTDLHGIIESPNFPNDYPSQLDCLWIIRAPKGNKINITFTHFDLEETFLHNTSSAVKENLFDYLEISEDSDGDLKSTHFGSQLPPKYHSSSNIVSIAFHTDSFKAGNGFRLEWAVDGCGGHLMHSFGSLSSPNYPKLYPTETECFWTIEVDPDQAILFVIKDMDTEMLSEHCRADYLKIYNGPTNEYPLLSTLCGKIADNSVRITSTGNFLRVEFHSDSSITLKGFLAMYSSITSKCGGSFKGVSGKVTSPNYPKNYENDLECFYYLEVPEHHTMSLNFIDFDLDSSDDCPDYVKVYDGIGPESNLMDKLCGGTAKNFTSTTNKLTLEFKSDSSITSKGFQVEYKTSCGSKIVTSSEGVVSLNDNFFASSDNCTWVIESEKLDGKISLTLTYLDLDDFDNCTYSFVEVFAGDSINASSLGKYCGHKSPPTFISRGNALTVFFVPLSIFSFSFHYSVLSTACGGNLTSEAGEFTSPMYPDSYPPNLRCVWTVNVSPGNSFTLSFEKFKIQTTESCDGDYVEIREENGIGRLVGVYCDDSPPTIRSFKTLWIKFSTDSIDGDEGFIAQYSYDIDTDIINIDIGQLVSPLYPLYYKNPTSREWRITVTTGGFIVVTFKEISILTYGEHCYDFLRVYDGYSKDAPVLGSYCGFEVPAPVSSTSNVVLVQLQLNRIPADSLFRIEWIRMSLGEKQNIRNSNCSGNQTTYVAGGSQMSIQSPGFPDGYEHNLECEWIFETSPTQSLFLKFDTVSMEETDSCYSDKVKIFSGERGSEDWKQVGPSVCHLNDTVLEPIQVSNLMKVVFQTDVSVNKSGFSGTVYSDCGNSVEASSGIIVPERPNLIRAFRTFIPMTCMWDVTVGKGRTIKVEFLELNITRSIHDVCESYVMIRNGGNEHSPLLGKGKYCGTSLPPDELVTSSNRLHVTYFSRFGLRFQQSKASAPQAFKLRFSEVTLPCGDSIVLNDDFNSTDITSPNYPEIPHPYSECSWVVSAEAVHRLAVSFVDRFDLTISKDCDKEFVEIRDGGSEFSKLLGRFCEKPKKILKTSGNMMFLKFYTNIPVPKNGFKALITIDICGGTIYGTKGTINPPNELSLAFIKRDLICEWHIVSPSYNVLQINMKNIFIPQNDNCSESYLQVTENVLDSQNNITNVNLTEKICGMDGEMAITTNTNECIIKYAISKSLRYTLTPFQITFNTSKLECGGEYNQPSGVIETKLYKKMLFQNCEWKITVPEGRRVKLQIEGNDNFKLIRGSWFIIYGDHKKEMLLEYYFDVNTANDKIVESSSNKMLVAYHGLTMPISLKMSYSSDEPSVCDGNFELSEGVLTPPVTNLSRIYCEYEYKLLAGDSNGTLMIKPYPNDTTICQNIVLYSVYVYVPQVGRFGNLCPYTSILSPYLNTRINMQKKLPAKGFAVSYKLYPCGGVIENVLDGKGIFTLPKGHIGPLKCAWVINIPPGQYLEIKFNEVKFGSESCDDEFVQIKMGRTPSSHKSNKLCHNHIPNEPLTFHLQHLWVDYQTENFSSSTMLNMSLDVSNEDHSVSKACGGKLSSYVMRYRTFTTPNFPNAYSDNMDCEWTLTAEDGYRISLQFENRFYLESAPNCSKDYIEIYDYKLDVWKSVGKYCGRDAPPDILSSAEGLKIVFHSDDAKTGDGFQAHWSLICGGTFEVTETPQRLKSPGRTVYGRNLDCNYTLTQSQDKHVNIKFEYFALESDFSRICKYDNLSISSEFSNENEIYCGSNSPGLKRLNPPVNLRFMTDRWVQKRGFLLWYSLDSCGENITTSGVMITLPKVDNKYFSSSRCDWYITAPEDKSVVLRFKSLVLEYSSECYYDYVEVFDKSTKDEFESLGKFCGNLTTSLPVIRSKKNVLKVTFKTDGSNEYDGFTADVLFSYDENHGCGGVVNLTGTSRPLHIFANNKVYEPYLDCHWLFKTAENDVINIKFTEFNVSKCFNTTSLGNCDCDFLEFRDGPGSHSQLIGKYCGDLLPENITSSKNYLWMRFVSDGTVESSGVHLYAEAQSSICGPSELSIAESVAELSTPRDKNGFMPKNVRCEWLLLSHSSNVHLKFHNFDVGSKSPDGNSCGLDYLELSLETNTVYRSDDELIVSEPLNDAYNTFYTQVQNSKRIYCGSLSNFDENIHFANVRLRLVTSSSQIQHRGFNLSYSNIGCSANYTKGYAKIELNPSYDSENCRINIEAPVNHTVTLYLFSYTTYGSECSHGYVEVVDGLPENSKSLIKQCGDAENLFISSTKNTMALNIFRPRDEVNFLVSSFVTTDKGMGCGGTIVDHSGKILSPLYPNTFRENKVCEWVILSPKSSISVTFDVFDIGVSRTCDLNYLELLDENGLSLVKHCSQSIPAPFLVLNPYVKISYHTTTSNFGSGWVISFT